MGILGLGERQRVRLFVRRDPLDRFVECLVCIPRDRFNTENRERVGADPRSRRSAAATLDWTPAAVASRCSRACTTSSTAPTACRRATTTSPRSRRGSSQATRAWTDDLRDALIEEHGEERGVKLYRRYERAFPPGYRADWVARSAVADIARIEELAATRRADHEPVPAARGAGGHRALQAVQLGRRVAVRRAADVRAHGREGRRRAPVRDHAGRRRAGLDLRLRPAGATPRTSSGSATSSRRRSSASGGASSRTTGSTGWCSRAALTGREITIVRAVAKYLRQAGIAFSDAYMERTLLGHPDIAALLVELFDARFDPDRARPRRRRERIAREIEEAIDAVQSLDEDRILRSFLARGPRDRCAPTTSERRRRQPRRRPYLSFKLDPSQIPVLPLPRPQFEIFVYSPRVEGVHLRGGKVARGGLRWSDRREDFRTEVLGLMKAQMVKNALIVPVGSKGGFVRQAARRPTAGARRCSEEAIACYRTFLSGLLDITDNIVGGEVVAARARRPLRRRRPLPGRRRRQGHGDVLGHRQRGLGRVRLLARRRVRLRRLAGLRPQGDGDHRPRRLGVGQAPLPRARHRHPDDRLHGRRRSATCPATCSATGCCSRAHIKLVAAFNHLHVFLDPDPDPERELRGAQAAVRAAALVVERLRRVADLRGRRRLPAHREVDPDLRRRSARRSRSRPTSSSPNELIRAILRAPVDLLWNGGIGTYVKASTETHADAGDKANDAVRVDGARAALPGRRRGRQPRLHPARPDRVRARPGGRRINTDAIDNVAGVNCSDHEVNIKILLDGARRRRRHDREAAQRAAGRDDRRGRRPGALRQLHADPGDEPGPGPGGADGRRPRAADPPPRADRRAEPRARVPARDETIAERKAAHQGLVAPELAVVMAYCKIHLYAAAARVRPARGSRILAHDLERYFPPPLPERYSRADARPPPAPRDHRDRRRQPARRPRRHHVRVPPGRGDRRARRRSSRAPTRSRARCSTCARSGTPSRRSTTRSTARDAARDADRGPAPGRARDALAGARQPLTRSTSRRPSGASSPAREMLAAALPGVLDGSDREAFDGARRRARARRRAGRARPPGGRHAVAARRVRHRRGRRRRPSAQPEVVIDVYFRLGSRLELNWLRDRIIELPRANRWQALARAALRDDLYSLHRSLTREVLEAGGRDADRRRRSRPGRSATPTASSAPGDARRHQGLADLRHDDAAGRAARGPQPAPRIEHGPGWPSARSRWPSSPPLGRPPPRIQHEQQRDIDRSGDQEGDRPRHQSACDSRNHASSYRPERKRMADSVTTTVTELPESRVRVAGRGRPPRRSSAASSRPRASSAARCGSPASARARSRRRS